MRKLTTILALVAILVSALIFTSVPAYTEELSKIDEDALNEVYAEELYAKRMYEIMTEKFDNDDFYQKLIQSETKHANSIKRLLEKYDLPVVETESEPKISDDELEALTAALEFEVNDVKSLEERIAKAKNQEEIQHYERLKERSERHVKLLESAIEQFEEGNKDLSELRCEQNKRMNCQGKFNSNSYCRQRNKIQKQGERCEAYGNCGGCDDCEAYDECNARNGRVEQKGQGKDQARGRQESNCNCGARRKNP